MYDDVIRQLPDERYRKEKDKREGDWHDVADRPTSAVPMLTCVLESLRKSSTVLCRDRYRQVRRRRLFSGHDEK
jgi:hypothetical protein